MPRYLAVVRREIPCAPYWADVTAPEIDYVGLTKSVGYTFEAATDDAAEAWLVEAWDAANAGMGSLDRTYFTVVNVATGAEIATRLDLSISEDD